MLFRSQIAKALTNELNKQFGDERYFDLSSMVSSQPLTLVHDPDAEGVGTELNIDLSDLPTFTASFTNGNKVTDASKVQISQLVYAMQKKIDAAVAAKVAAKTLPADTAITVSYDPFTRGLKFKESDNTNMGIRSNVNSNSIFGLTTSLELLNADGGYSALVGPNGDFIRPLNQQRYGLKVEFDNVKQNFTISSGTTGDS